MRLSELIATIGDDNVQFQNLDNDSISLNYDQKRGSTITFGSQMPIHPANGTEKLGLVVWLPRDEVAKIQEPNHAL